MDKHDKIGVFALCIITGLLSFFFGGIYTCIDYEKRPSAKDVYRGKTTLEITYRDSVAIDSTVVYKSKIGMTRRGEIEKVANEFYKGDEVSTFVVAAQWADKTMIEKACK